MCKVTSLRFVQGNHHAPPASQNHAVAGNSGATHWRGLKPGPYYRDESRVGAAKSVMDGATGKTGGHRGFVCVDHPDADVNRYCGGPGDPFQSRPRRTGPGAGTPDWRPGSPLSAAGADRRADRGPGGWRQSGPRASNYGGEYWSGGLPWLTHSASRRRAGLDHSRLRWHHRGAFRHARCCCPDLFSDADQ